jgi:hypothetical protein
LQYDNVYLCVHTFVLAWGGAFYERTDMSRLTIDVTEQQHQSLKVMAALQGKSIREYALERLFPPPRTRSRRSVI